MPDRRIIVIHKSITVFILGIIGLLPLMGAMPAVFALFRWRQILARYRDEWNPAAAYLSWGARLAAIGLLSSTLLVLVIIISAL